MTPSQDLTLAGVGDGAGGRMIVAISLAIGAIGGLCWGYLIWIEPCGCD